MICCYQLAITVRLLQPKSSSLQRSDLCDDLWHAPYQPCTCQHKVVHPCVTHSVPLLVCIAIHVSRVCFVGLWLSPTLTGDRPPPSDGFTFTSIDSHRAVLFGGILHDRRYINDVYVIDFRKMVNYCSVSICLR